MPNNLVYDNDDMTNFWHARPHILHVAFALLCSLATTSCISANRLERTSVLVTSTAQTIIELPTTQDSEEDLELGILESGIYFEVHPPRTVEISNIWQGYVEGDLTRVYAGRLRRDTRMDTSIVEDDSTFGAVYLMQRHHGGTVTVETFLTETEIGSLRIIDVNENSLVLESDGGRLQQATTLYFDLIQRQLLDSIAED